MPQLRCLLFFVFFTEQSPQAYSAYQTKNAAFGGINCFVTPAVLLFVSVYSLLSAKYKMVKNSRGNFFNINF
jgi:hypothetical protein